MQKNKDKIFGSLEQLVQWLEFNGFAGYDPYDVKAHPVIIKISALGNHNKAATILREVVFELLYTFPLISRKALGIKPAINAKSMGLLASSYLDLYSICQEESYLEKALSCLNWLKACKNSDYNGYGWGYPFDWQSKELIPAGTPNGIVTTVVRRRLLETFPTYRRQGIAGILHPHLRISVLTAG